MRAVVRSAEPVSAHRCPTVGCPFMVRVTASDQEEAARLATLAVAAHTCPDLPASWPPTAGDVWRSTARASVTLWAVRATMESVGFVALDDSALECETVPVREFLREWLPAELLFRPGGVVASDADGTNG